MAVKFINVESFFFLRKFNGTKNPLMSASIAYFVFLRRSAKNMAAKFKGRAPILSTFFSKSQRGLQLTKMDG